jgi:hypothetical protein
VVVVGAGAHESVLSFHEPSLLLLPLLSHELPSFEFQSAAAVVVGSAV